MVIPGKTYPLLPDELKPYEVYFKDTGFCVMCIPNCFRDKAKSEPDSYEVGVPSKYVMSHPYTIENGYVYIDVNYDPVFGISVSSEYTLL